MWSRCMCRYTGDYAATRMLAVEDTEAASTPVLLKGGMTL